MKIELLIYISLSIEGRKSSLLDINLGRIFAIAHTSAREGESIKSVRGWRVSTSTPDKVAALIIDMTFHKIIFSKNFMELTFRITSIFHGITLLFIHSLMIWFWLASFLLSSWDYSSFFGFAVDVREGYLTLVISGRERGWVPGK